MNSDIIPQANPRANYFAHKQEIDAAVADVLNSGQFISGRHLLEFEREFGDYLGGVEVIGAGSGTEAINLALRAADIGQDDVVVTVSHTAGATVTAIELAGATPVLVDVDAASFTIDTNTLEDKIERLKSAYAERLKAILVVHLYGQAADIETVRRICERHGLLLIEDCAQAHGASTGNKRAGTLGDIAAFSFYPTKNLSAMGDGGAVVTGNAAMAQKARMIREYGWKDRYVSTVPGMNTRLDELQAAILRVKLKYLEAENSRRRTIASMYDEILSGSAILTPHVRNDCHHVYHQYVIRTEKRDDLRNFLTVNSIQTSIHYPLPVHLQPAYKNRIPLGDSLQVTERLAREILSLPVYPELTNQQVERIGEAILGWSKQL
jgi:dTDP-4-amino-4,6-dideoxygalactose transaminase